MAIRYAVAAGNWSDTTTWDGGTLPTVGDDVYDNGFIVTINQDIEVNKISTELCPTTLVGGGHFVSNGVRTYICDIVAGLVNCLRMFTGPTTVIGDVYGSETAASASGMQYWNTNIFNCDPIVIGNVYGRKGVGLYLASRTQVATVTGNVYADENYGIYMLYNTTYSRSVVITGNVYASALKSGVIFGTLDLVGSSIPTGAQPGCYSILGGSAKICGTYDNVEGMMAVSCPRTYIEPTEPTAWKFQDSDLNDIQLYTQDAFNQPAEEDVREGIEYGSTNFQGTLAVPDPSNVVRGIPTDNTIGDYELSTDLVERLNHCSTVEITGAQIAGFTP